MDNSKEAITNRTQKILRWIKKPSNLVLTAIIILAIIIRLYYFTKTSTQPLWWDEADYMSYAKNLAGLPVDWIVSGQHNTIFYFFVALLVKLSFSEAAMKFVLELLPSIALVFLTYAILSKMYKDKKIALISTFLMAIFWAILFNTNRFHLGIPSMLFGFLAIYIYWQGYEMRSPLFGKFNPKWAIPLAVVFTILAYGVRRGYFLFGIVFLVYMLSTRKFSKLIKDKYNWIGLVTAVVLLFILENIIFIRKITEVAKTYTHSEAFFSLLPLDVFKVYFQISSNPLYNPFYYLFMIGFVVVLINVLFSLGYIKKLRASKSRADLFAILTILITMSYFIFTGVALDGFGEARWYFPMLLAVFVCVSRGTLLITNYVKRYSPHIAIALIFILMALGGYHQVTHADDIINSRSASFEGIKLAGLHIKSIAAENDVVIGYPTPQFAYYTERSVIDPERLMGKYFGETTLEEFLGTLESNPEIRFVPVYFFEPALPDWMRRTNYVQHPQTGQPVMQSWEIPFMDTKIDFLTGEQNIQQSKTYNEITFSLSTIQQDVFVYEVVR
jgi:hypothetical protein